MRRPIFSLLTILFFGALSAPNILAQEVTNLNHVVQKELVVSGAVDVVLDGEKMIRIKTAYGTVIEVPLSTLGPWSNQQIGWLELKPGESVSARMNPGLLGVAPANQGRIWITIDEKKFLRMYAKDIDKNLFDDDRNVVQLDQGREVDISVSELLQTNVQRLEPGNW